MTNLTAKFDRLERLLRTIPPDGTDDNGAPTWSEPYDVVNIGETTDMILQEIAISNTNTSDTHKAINELLGADERTTLPGLAARLDVLSGDMSAGFVEMSERLGDIASLLGVTNNTLAVLVKSIRSLVATQEKAASCCTVSTGSELVEPPIDYEDGDVTTAKAKLYRAIRWVNLGSSTHDGEMYIAWAPVFPGRPGFFTPTIMADGFPPYQHTLAPVGANVGMAVTWDWMTSGSARPHYHYSWAYPGAPGSPTVFAFLDSWDVRKDSFQVVADNGAQKLFSGILFWAPDNSDHLPPPLNIWAMYTGTP